MKIKRISTLLIASILVLTLVLLIVTAVSPPGSFQSKAEISITGNGFSPATVTVNRGTLVTFINNDSLDHRLVSELEGFDSQTPIPPNGSYSYLFDKEGTWAFGDEDSYTGLQGKVIVK